MDKGIDLPINVFNRLAKHASGFDTPGDVITRLLDFYEVNSLNKENLQNDDIVAQAFSTNFKVEPRAFGQKQSAYYGYSDDNRGVQWNIAVNKATGAVILGVNLEGMKYKDWPIANLLLNEDKQSSLHKLTNIRGAEEVKLIMTRDAWQAASRPKIAEKNIAPSDLLLSDLTQNIWAKIIDESLECLNVKLGYKARGEQLVTLINKEPPVQKLMPVSPHLGFKVVISKTTPESFDSLLVDIKRAQKILKPLYDFTLNQSRTLKG